jgi:hypothetical protein
MSKFGRGHGSRRPLSNLRRVTPVTEHPQSPKRRKKDKVFGRRSKFLVVSRKIPAGRIVELFKWVTGHDRCRFERNTTVFCELEYVQLYVESEVILAVAVCSCCDLVVTGKR